MKRDVLAGVLLVNTIPHAVMGFAGKRQLTPLGGEQSSARTNLVWAGMNLAGGLAALGSGGWRSAAQAEADHRLATMQAGIFAFATFGLLYELTAGRRKRAVGRPGPATSSRSTS